MISEIIKVQRNKITPFLKIRNDITTLMFSDPGPDQDKIAVHNMQAAIKCFNLAQEFQEGSLSRMYWEGAALEYSRDAIAALKMNSQVASLEARKLVELFGTL